MLFFSLYTKDTEREKDEQEFLERFLSEEEEVFQDNEQPATKNDEEFERAKEADTPVGDTKGDKERIDEADTPVGGTEGDEELPEEADSLEAEEIAEIPGKNTVRLENTLPIDQCKNG